MKNSGFDKLVKVYSEILYAIGSIFYVTFCVCVMVQIISRNFLPSAPSWTEELARYSFIYMVAFGCGIAVLKDEFVFVEFLKDSLEVKGLHQANKIIRILVTFVMLIISLYILVMAEPTFCFIKFRMVSTAMQIPMQYIYFGSIIFLVGLAMPHYRLLIPSASLDMNLRQCFRVITPTATNSGTACFLTPRRTQAS